MADCDKLFNRIDELGKEYIDFREAVCHIESPTAHKAGVSDGGIHAKNEYARISTLKDAAKRIASICYCIE